MATEESQGVFALPWVVLDVFLDWFQFVACFLGLDRLAPKRVPQVSSHNDWPVIPGPGATIHRSLPGCRLRKTLVLDLDETLVHSSFRETPGSDLRVHVVLESVPCVFYVFKRPHVQTFLRTVAEWYEVVIFTASLQRYADPVVDALDEGRGKLRRRYYRESCVLRNGSYVKRLSDVSGDPAHVLIVDNSPAAYQLDRPNALPIKGWFSDKSDTALVDMLPLLDALRFVHDVRHVLARKDMFGPGRDLSSGKRAVASWPGAALPQSQSQYRR